MEIELFLKSFKKTNSHSFYVVTGVMYEKSYDINENNFHKIGVKSSSLSFCSFNDASLSSMLNIDEVSINTLPFESYLSENIWQLPPINSNIEYLHILTRNTSLKNIYMFYGLFCVSSYNEFFEGNTFYRVNNGMFSKKESFDINTDNSISHILTNYLWFLNGSHFYILNSFMEDTIKKLFKLKKINLKIKSGAVLDYDEIDILELFKRDHHYSQLTKIDVIYYKNAISLKELFSLSYDDLLLD